jgi:hypothetical protein
MEQDLGYFCRAYVGQDVQANVIARTLREAEMEIARMIRGGADIAHAVPHGASDSEPVLVATAYGGTADGEMWRYLRQNHGPEFDRWQVTFQSKTKILDDRWVVIELSATGIKEYSAYGKAVRAIWGTATAAQAISTGPVRREIPHSPEPPHKGPAKTTLFKSFTSKAG